MGCEDFLGTPRSLEMKRCCLWQWGVEEKIPTEHDKGEVARAVITVGVGWSCGTTVMSLTLRPHRAVH